MNALIHAPHTNLMRSIMAITRIEQVYDSAQIDSIIEDLYQDEKDVKRVFIAHLDSCSDGDCGSIIFFQDYSDKYHTCIFNDSIHTEDLEKMKEFILANT